jgi:Phage capsid protein
MPYDSTVPDHYTVDFANSAQMKRDRVNKVISQYSRLETNCSGARKTFNVDDFVNGREVTGQRFAKLNVQEPKGEIRSVTPRKFDLTLGKDGGDGNKLYPLIVGDGKHLMQHTRYYNRQCDNVFRTGIRGPNYVGPEGTVVTNVPTVLPVNFVQTGSAVASNLTLGKLIQVTHLFRKLELVGKDSPFPEGKIHMAINADMMKSLVVNVDQVSNKMYSEVMALERGTIDEFHGIIFHRTEDVPTTTDPNIFEALAWIPELCAMAVWQDFMYRAWEESTLSFAPLTYSCFEVAACRLQDNAVIPVACNTSL